MKPVVLLVGRLPNVIENVAKQLEDLPVEWLGDHNAEEVGHQLDAEPRIECVMMGGSLDDAIRGELLGVIAQKRPDICIYIRERDWAL